MSAPQSENRPTPLWQKLLLIAGGTAFAIGLLVLLLTLFPGLIPGFDFDERKYAGVTLEVQFRVMDGDMFAEAGRVRPVEDNAVLEAFTIAWDNDGFRVPARLAENYPIAILGDSFTEGANVPRPYADVLAEMLDTPVQNLGYRNYGPSEIARTAREFLPKSERQWVLYGHFGNDFGDAIRTEQQAVTERSAGYLLPWILERAADNIPVPDSSINYTYPMPVIIGGNYYEMGYHEYLLWWQLAPETGFENSKSYETIASALDAVTESVAPETCRALIFIPTKEQLYYPYTMWQARKFLLYVAMRPGLLPDGFLQLQAAPLTDADDEAFIRRLDGQRDAMRDLAAAKNWHFIDLLDVFKTHVAQGELLYYPYDGHWNQAGHTLAAQTIADTMQGVSACD